MSVLLNFYTSLGFTNLADKYCDHEYKNTLYYSESIEKAYKKLLIYNCYEIFFKLLYGNEPTLSMHITLQSQRALTLDINIVEHMNRIV